VPFNLRSYVRTHARSKTNSLARNARSSVVTEFDPNQAAAHSQCGRREASTYSTRVLIEHVCFVFSLFACCKVTYLQSPPYCQRLYTQPRHIIAISTVISSKTIARLNGPTYCQAQLCRRIRNSTKPSRSNTTANRFSLQKERATYKQKRKSKTRL
jgi:hypothetical protein